MCQVNSEKSKIKRKFEAKGVDYTSCTEKLDDILEKVERIKINVEICFNERREAVKLAEEEMLAISKTSVADLKTLKKEAGYCEHNIAEDVYESFECIKSVSIYYDIFYSQVG